jgi:acyl carrier protein
MKDYKDKQELAEALRNAISEEFEIDLEKLTPEATIKETLDLDSLSLVDLIAVIEAESGVKLKGTDVTHIITFEALYDFIWNQR